MLTLKKTIKEILQTGDRSQTEAQIFRKELRTLQRINICVNKGWGKSRLTVERTQNTELILLLFLTNYCIIFHSSNCKPTFAPPCIRHLHMYKKNIDCISKSVI